MMLKNLPDKVIVGIEDSIVELRNEIGYCNIPTVDIDVLVDFLIDTVSRYTNIDDQILGLLDALIDNEIFGSKLNSEHEKELLPLLICTETAAKKMYQCLKESGLLTNLCLNFEYDGLINEHTLLLRRRRQ